MQEKNLAIILTLLGLTAILFNHISIASNSDFELWKQKFGVSYGSMFEQAYRERVFLENLAAIKLHNSNELRTYDQGINQFTALTQKQFEQKYLGLAVEANIVFDDSEIAVADVDWVAAGATTPPKDQGQCGSYWAFSTTGGLEGLYKLAYGNLQSFSEQQLIDCSGSYGNSGCNGGSMTNALKYVKENGIVLQSEYPYKAVRQTCTKSQGAFKISGFTEAVNCNQLASAIAARPVSVAIDASNWPKYSSGVFNNCATRLNHAATLVGVIGGNWWIKNSWGTSWGQKGYIRLQAGNTCAVCSLASYPNK